MRAFAAAWLIAVVLLAADPASAGPARGGKSGGHISVMTQNVYIGTDILALAESTTVCGLLRAAGDALDQVEANDFSQRAVALADLVLAKSPDVLALQEAVTVSYADFFGIEYQFDDYLTALVEALDGHYYLVEKRSSAELEVPANRVGSCDEDNPLSSVDARATVVDQDAFLCRVGLECEPGGAENFSFNTQVATPAGDVVIERGWVGIVARVKGQDYQLFNTHLEVNSNEALRTVQYLQSLELADVLNSFKTAGMPQIVLGDFNSEEGSGQPVCAELDFCQTSYQVLQGLGFLDTWTLRGGTPQTGHTCCQDADLQNEDSALTARIDQVWIRGPGGHQGGALARGVQAEVLGTEPFDRSEPDELWPSDHAAVITRMWVSPYTGGSWLKGKPYNARHGQHLQ